MVCDVCNDNGTYIGCWKCGKKLDESSYDGVNFFCRNCGWELERDGDSPQEKINGHHAMHLCPKCGYGCTPIDIS